MARLFNSKMLNNILEDHRKYFFDLKNAESLEKQYREEIIKSADKLKQIETLNILKGIPIEEINTYKGQFPVKLLRENRIYTIADLYKSSTSKIISIKGISRQRAFEIKQVAIELFQKSIKEIKVSLSIDNKSSYATNLVKSITQYKKSLHYIERCQKIMLDNSEKIYSAISDVKICQKIFNWIFSSKSKKEKANHAYEFLKDLLVGEYGRNVKDILDKINSLETLSEEKVWNEFVEDPVSFFNILEDIYPGLLGTDDLVYGLPEDLAEEVQEEGLFSEGLLCKLRRYQEWGVKYILRQEKVLLGDEMGLGKTIQAIAAMVSLRNTGATHFVVICPASVIENWCREICKHSTLSVIKVHGRGRIDALNSWIEKGGVAVTTYETTVYFDLDSSFRFCMLVVDEAHYIKNPGAKRSQNVKRLSKHVERMLFMTGTALENRVNEIIELIKILQPDIVRDMNCVISLSESSEFRKKIAPVYYRRKREEVLTELPDLIENEEWCTMSKEEEKVYESSLMGHFMSIRRLSWNINDIKNSSKAKRMLEIIKDAESEGRKVIIFSFFLEVINKISLLLEDKCLGPINGSISPQARQKIIDDFDKADPGTVLLSQIQAGGTGLNIQSASVVILCEPQLKPSIENQAISRAYRMGQTRNVLVYRLLCENTIDKNIMDILARKQLEFDEFADKSEAASKNFEIDEKTFGNIIKQEIDRINRKKKENQELLV